MKPSVPARRDNFWGGDSDSEEELEVFEIPPPTSKKQKVDEKVGEEFTTTQEQDKQNSS